MKIVRMLPFFSGRTLLVTGGSSGIGRAVAILAAQSGAHVHLIARNAGRLESAVQALRAAATSPAQRMGATSLDVSDREAVERAAGPITDEMGGLDVLVNNAGVSFAGRIADTSPSVFTELMNINYFGALWVTRAFLPALCARPGSRVVFVSSLAGLLGVYGYGAYTPTKFAMTGLAQVLRQELLAERIGVSTVFPPDVDTPMLQRELDDCPAGTRAVSGKVVPMTAEAVARELLAGVAKGRCEIIPGVQSRLTMWGARHFPWLARWVIDRALSRLARASLTA
jgi:3-dehydrosphinganine reductase